MAEENRMRPTSAEERLWEHYLRHKPCGYKFRRQHPLHIFIADFYCHAVKLVIELDGSIHDRLDVQITDRERQNFLEGKGLTVLRFSNTDVMERLTNVTQTIERHFTVP